MAEQVRRLSLHGLSNDAWKRYANSASWDYLILDTGYKYNMTDIAASLGIHQLKRAEELRRARAAIADFYHEALADVPQVELPPVPDDRIHSWHLFAIRLRLDRLTVGRNEFMTELREMGIGCSVHWRPLHLHPYYQETFGWQPQHLPVASSQWQRLVSLPIFPGMRTDEQEYVVDTVHLLCNRFATNRRPSGDQ
jgi:perosamine synthetase